MMDIRMAEHYVMNSDDPDRRIEAVQYLTDPNLIEMLIVSDVSEKVQNAAKLRIKELKNSSKKAKKIVKHLFRYENKRFREENAENVEEFMKYTNKAKWNTFYTPDAKKNLKILKILYDFCYDDELKTTVLYAAAKTGEVKYESIRVGKGYRKIWVETFEWIMIIRHLYLKYDDMLDYRYSLIKFGKGEAQSDKEFLGDSPEGE